MRVPVPTRCPYFACSRKTLGYLYAISQGATAIYDADDAVELLQDHIPLLSCNQTSPELLPAQPSNPTTTCKGILTQLKPGPTAAALLFNPYPLFGQPHVCPRGIAPMRVPQGTNASECFKRGSARPIIQQGLINGRPDVDDTYHGSQPLDIAFARSGFSVVMPHGVATPLNRCVHVRLCAADFRTELTTVHDVACCSMQSASCWKPRLAFQAFPFKLCMPLCSIVDMHATRQFHPLSRRPPCSTIANMHSCS